jgi:hypothetical protein
MRRRRHPAGRGQLREEIQQGTQLETRGYDPEDERRAQVAAGLSLIISGRLRRAIHPLC